MGARRFDADQGGPIQPPLLNNPGDAKLHFVDWYGLSESNLPQTVSGGRAPAMPAMEIPVRPMAADGLWPRLLERVRRLARALGGARRAQAERTAELEANVLGETGEAPRYGRGDGGAYY